MQLKLSGLIAKAAAVVVGQLPRCDEPDGQVTGRSVFAEMFADFPRAGRCSGFPTGHTTTPLVSVAASACGCACRPRAACRGVRRSRRRLIAEDRVARIHFIGVCGTAMATLAAMLKAAASTSQGSDQASIRR